MAIESITNFVRKAPFDPASAWVFQDVLNLAGETIPDMLLGDHQPLLKGDQHRLWLRWFLEGLASPIAIARNPALERLDIFAVVSRRVKGLYPQPHIDDIKRRDLAERITDHLYADVIRLRADVQRDHASKGTRHELIAERDPPRCYICGYAFSKEVRDAFLRVKGSNRPALPVLVDVFRPRLGLRDISIEIDHLVPVEAGGQGQGNLKLACGWCNKHKSARVSLYEASFTAPTVPGFRVGKHQLFELPNPFWIIRLLALKGRCQHESGCLKSASDAELFVALNDWQGSPNPTNLMVFCQDHDPIAVDRMQDSAVVKSLWEARRR